MPKALTQKNKVNNLFTPSLTPPKLLPAKGLGKRNNKSISRAEQRETIWTALNFPLFATVLRVISLNSFKFGDKACSFG